jgi:hypothetical protein
MVVCTGGSAPNNSSLGIVEISGSFLNSILPGGLQWFDAYLWLVPPFTVDIPAFCATDPPALPTLDDADLLSIVTGGRLGSLLVGIQKAQQLLSVYAWYQMCHCVGTSTPAPPAGQAQPTGSPVLNPPGVGTGSIECARLVSNQEIVPPSKFVNQISMNLPVGAQSVALTMANISAGALHNNMQWAYRFVDVTNNNPVGVPTLPVVASGVTRTDILTVPPTGTRFEASVTVGNVTVTNLAQTTAVVTCSSTPLLPVSPPDPQTDGLLRQILNLVTLIQRQAVPFAYVPGTVHSGLSGAGTISIQGLIGAKVAVTTLPAALGVEGTTPAEHFDLGWITFATADGYPSSYRLEHNPQLMLPARCGAYTEIDYDLHPGVVVTITELKREP